MKKRCSAVFLCLIGSCLSLSLLSRSAQSQALPRIESAVDPQRNVVLANSATRLPADAVDLGPVRPDVALDRLILQLKASPEQEAALSNFVNAQQDS